MKRGTEYEKEVYTWFIVCSEDLMRNPYIEQETTAITEFLKN